MNNKHLTPVWIVYVDGQRLDIAHEGALQRIVVDDKLNDVGLATLEFDTSYLQVRDAGTFWLESEVSVHLGYKDDCQQVFVGEVTEFIQEYREYGHQRLKVVCKSCLHRLQNAHQALSVESKTLSEALVSRLESYGIKAQVDSFGTKKYFVESQITDYEFLMESANKYGKTVYAHGNKVYVQDEVTISNEDVVLEWGKSLVYFRGRESLKGQLSGCSFVGWDSRKGQGITGRVSLGEVPVKVGGGRSWEDNSKAAGGRWHSTIMEESLRDREEAVVLAKAYLQNLSTQYQTAECKCEGDQRILPGMRVTVKYVGESYSGEYIANHVIHEFSVYGGYTTTLYLKRNMAGGEKKRVSEIERERASRAVGEMIREFQISSPNEHLDIETSTEGISTTVPTEETESGLRDESSESRIESVEFLDDEGSPISAGTFKNFVNLGSDGKFIDKKEIKGYYQLAGNARVKVKFSDKGEQPFSLRLECVGGKLEYSEDEKKANIRYKVWSGVQQFLTDSSGMAVVDLKKEIDGFSLGQGGGQKFKVVVSDDEGGERRTGGILETWRRLYVVEVKMQGLDSTAGTIDILKGEFRRHCIDILNLGEEEVAHRSNISTNEDLDKFTEEAMKVCSKYKEYDSHLVRIGYTDHLADKMELLVDDDGELINTNQKDVEITVKDTNDTTYSLWKGINDEDWFVGCTFIDARTKERYDIPQEACTPLTNDGMNYETVKVEISRLFQEIGSVSGELDLKVNVVKGMSGGVSRGNQGIIAVCTRAWWKKKSPEGMGQTLVHEIGHQVGMVPGERALSGLAQGKYHYLGLGHVGNHCHNGCDLEDDIDKKNNKWNGNAREKSTCVMFGSANGKESFCSECAMQVRKVDLSEGVY